MEPFKNKGFRKWLLLINEGRSNHVRDSAEQFLRGERQRQCHILPFEREDKRTLKTKNQKEEEKKSDTLP